MNKIKILIMGTARTNRIYDVIDANINQELYLLIQSSRVSQFKKYCDSINIIKTDETFIDYNTVRHENRIPNVMFDKVIIPSIRDDNVDDFGEAYAIASGLRCTEIIFSGPSCEKIVESGFGEKVTDLIYSFNGIIQYKLGRILTRMVSALKGYKW